MNTTEYSYNMQEVKFVCMEQPTIKIPVVSIQTGVGTFGETTKVGRI